MRSIGKYVDALCVCGHPAGKHRDQDGRVTEGCKGVDASYASFCPCTKPPLEVVLDDFRFLITGYDADGFRVGDRPPKYPANP